MKYPCLFPIESAKLDTLRRYTNFIKHIKIEPKIHHIFRTAPKSSLMGTQSNLMGTKSSLMGTKSSLMGTKFSLIV